ncbi:MAG TPA: ATP-dependent DNA ligase [Galbitalea sp.]
MGKLLYGSSRVEIEFDDRVLAHLQLVLSPKLRRHEGFFFSWRDDPAIGDGRSSIWLETSIPLFFRFASAERHQLNREWLEELTQSANQPAGLNLSAEPGEAPLRPRSRVS